jgi:hypothetical protein
MDRKESKALSGIKDQRDHKDRKESKESKETRELQAKMARRVQSCTIEPVQHHKILLLQLAVFGGTR